MGLNEPRYQDCIGESSVERELRIAEPGGHLFSGTHVQDASVENSDRIGSLTVFVKGDEFAGGE